MADVTEITKFDPRTIKDHTVVAIIGARGSGKSLLVRDILYHKRDIPYGIVMSGSEQGNKFYSKFIPDSFIYHRFDEGVLKRLVGRQQKMWGAGKRTRCFVVLDDLLYDKDVMKNETVRYIFMVGRHYGIFLIACAQFITDIPPGLRSNVDYAIACREPIVNNRKKLYEMFFGVFPKFKTFEKVFQACTKDYEVLVMDGTIKHSNQVQDVVFWYKANKAFYDRHRFRLGSERFWEFHHRVYGKFGAPGTRKISG